MKDCIPKEVPEPRLCNNLVRCENAHTVDLGGRIRLGREMATHDLVFEKTHLQMESKCPVSQSSNPIETIHPSNPLFHVIPVTQSAQTG